MSWLCICNTINPDSSTLCSFARDYSSRFPNTEHKLKQSNYYCDLEERVDYVRLSRLKNILFLSEPGIKLMTEADDLFARFFNDEKILVADMDSLTFRAREEELAKIAFEARARLTAMSETKREKSAKLKTSQKEWLIPSEQAENSLVSDAINAVAARKKRTNKAEKLQEQLKALGIGAADVNKLMSNVENNNTRTSESLVTFVDSKTGKTRAELVEDEKLAEEKRLEEERLKNLKDNPPSATISDDSPKVSFNPFAK